MQILIASPRDHLTDAQVRSLLTGDEVGITAGLDLLDSSNAFVEDISDDLASGEVTRNNFADVHGACRLVISRELAWGRDRVRPYMTLTNAPLTARFNLGVFVLTTPDSVRGETPASFTASGFDLLHLLQSGPGDTYAAESGTYFDAIQDAWTASGIGAPLLLDGTASATTLPAAMVWALTETQPATWLRIINDLLTAINYRGVWMDQDGNGRSEPYVAPSSRPVEWTFDTSDLSTDIVGEQRSLASDVWAAKNHWRFVRKNMTAQPVEGAGIYTVTNASTGRTSVAAMGRTIKAPVQYLDAADQASLVAQGDQIIAKDKAVSRTFTITVDPLPPAGHFDVVQLSDAGDSDKCQVTSWTLPLDGSQGR
ncbi:MAG TPA: hypothetical protein DDY88_03720, partial [Actinobacteria bacterium]|nr:hypothetical protein [Actinomycetota bacterium]